MTGRCDNVRDELAAYLSGEGNAGEREAIGAHLQTCGVCRREAAAQTQMRDSLRALKALPPDAAPPARVWKNASLAWNQRDARRRVRVQMRMALVGACLMLFVFGAVWARNGHQTGFPISAAMQDFAQINQGNAQPEFATGDADRAAQWLEGRLGVHVPAMNLDLAGAHLVGAGLVPRATPATGRLLYRTDQGLMALYVTPGGTDFGKLQTVVMNNYAFREDLRNDKVGILAWQRGGVGYGLALQKPLERGRIVAAEACRATE